MIDILDETFESMVMSGFPNNFPKFPNQEGSNIISSARTVSQPDYMTEEEFVHYHLVRNAPLYWETRNWTPVLIPTSNYRSAVEWLSENAVRGDRDNRNEWLHPMGQLFLLRDHDTAIKFKLMWGGQ